MEYADISLARHIFKPNDPKSHFCKQNQKAFLDMLWGIALPNLGSLSVFVWSRDETQIDRQILGNALSPSSCGFKYLMFLVFHFLIKKCPYVLGRLDHSYR